MTRRVRFEVPFALAALLTAAPLGAQGGVTTFAQLLRRPTDAARMLAPGQAREGTLDAADVMLGDSSHVELWYFEGKKGQRARLMQRSGDFDTYLHLGRHGGDAALADNDDGPDGTDSEIAITLPEDGVYVVIANAYSSADLGGYRVELQLEAPAPGMDGPVTPSRVMLREARPESRLGLGQRFGSQLDAQDQTMDDGVPFELWHITASAGDTLYIAVESAQFRPELYVARQGSERMTAEAMDPRRAVVRFNVLEGGTYSIVVRGQVQGVSGSYILELSRAGAPTP
jgi:hypothetical protein